MRSFTLSWRDRQLRLGPKSTIMGIVNVTPDSFSDGGLFHSADAAIAQAERLAEAGADIIDIGGESTRPFADSVSAEEEIERVVPVIKELAARISIPISIDTCKSQVAKAAIKAGASIINDISAMQMDPRMAHTAADLNVPIILMHMKGTPRTMQLDPVYEDVVVEVKNFLAEAVERAVAAGIDRKKIIVDPGIGFGKTGRHNLILINRLSEFEELEAPILVGPSRKRFIRDLLKDPSQEDISPDRPEVETGTQAAVAASILNGAHIIRVHNVMNTVAMVKVLDAIRNVK
ncbi:MAG: dihydropteroate synthase [Desulfobacteraceae bacterium]